MTDLDTAYSNAAFIPGGTEYPARWAVQAAGFREGMLEQWLADLGVSYGDSARQRFDLFLPGPSARGLCVIVHGGYWRALDPSVFSHLAGGAVARGWAVAMPGYDLCPQVSISDITQQIARAVTAASAMVAGPVALTGHSAGGHLVARMLEPGLLPDPVAARLTHVVPISMVSDLRPLLQTAMNADFRLTEAEAIAESPLLMPARLPVPVTLWVGGAERPVFLDQTRWLAEAWDVPQVIVPDQHHYNVIDALSDQDSDLLARLLG